MKGSNENDTNKKNGTSIPFSILTVRRDKEYTELHKSKYLSISPERNDITKKNVYSIDQTQNKYQGVSYINSSLENQTLSNRKRIQIENML